MWPYNLVGATGSTGKPRGYWTNGTNIYWDPLPDGTNTVRYYGFSSASDITAGGTFAYPDIVRLPLAAFAVRILKTGIDDNPEDAARFAEQTFTDVLDAMAIFNRDSARGLEYTQRHTT